MVGPQLYNETQYINEVDKIIGKNNYVPESWENLKYKASGIISSFSIIAKADKKYQNMI